MLEPFGEKCSRILSSAVIYAIFILWTLFLYPCVIGMAIVHKLSLHGVQAVCRRNIWRYGRSMLFWLHPWLPVSLRNDDLAVQHPASILVCNHQSFLDIYLLGAQQQSNLCLVTKHWPFHLLFFFAPAMRSAGYIDAENLPAEEVEAVCLQRLREGATLVIFPEGHRTRTGALGRFHVGAFHLAMQSGRPVLPLLVHNSFNVFPPHGKLFHPMRIRMEFLQAVYPRDFAATPLPHRAMMRYVRQLYATQLAAEAYS
ncbi:MAG: 1-acyl-sn-glycerol-3-phosphate acyltransferase [Desulfovibrio sp.]|nr:1-acyl-sn-glycerol-3-phosphate acyltransferase [Desulfovibrio sp.]